jgi:hypothetical protein
MEGATAKGHPKDKLDQSMDRLGSLRAIRV